MTEIPSHTQVCTCAPKRIWERIGTPGTPWANQCMPNLLGRSRAREASKAFVPHWPLEAARSGQWGRSKLPVRSHSYSFLTFSAESDTHRFPYIPFCVCFPGALGGWVCEWDAWVGDGGRVEPVENLTK